MRGNPWTRDEIIVAYTLYCITPLNKIRANNPLIQKAAEKINHSAYSLAMRMNNFMAVDTMSGEKGCDHAASADRAIYEEFKHDWYSLCCKAEEYLGFDVFADYNLQDQPLNGSKPISSLTERTRTNKERGIFRAELTAVYDGKCCITQIATPELLRASHIKDFSKSPDFQRVAPTNGLLLNTFHDALFDRGLITVLPDYTIKLSERIKRENDPNNEFAKRWIYGIEGTKIILPERFRPDKECLKWHNKNKFERWNN